MLREMKYQKQKKNYENVRINMVKGKVKKKNK
jgi:hypothetical protein